MLRGVYPDCEGRFLGTGQWECGSKKEGAGAWGNDEQRVERNAGETGVVGGGEMK